MRVDSGVCFFGCKLLDALAQRPILINIPATRAHMKSVNLKLSITIVFDTKRNLSMKRKKHSSCAEVTCELTEIWFRGFSKDGQIACSIGLGN
jgi:hypothetical protein